MSLIDFVVVLLPIVTVKVAFLPLSFRSVVQGDSSDPLSVTSSTDHYGLNGKIATESFTKSSLTYQSTSPAGRTASTVVDSQDRPLHETVPGITGIDFSYDTAGRPQSITQGTRQSSFTYDAAGNIASATDSLNRVTTYDHDAAGQLTAAHLAGGRELDYAYDADGNVTSVTPPSRPAHTFAYNLLDLAIGATAPDAGDGAPTTTYEYADADRDLTKITRPSGDAATLDYDSAGRLSTVNDAQGTTGVTYDPSTGNAATVTAPSGENLAFSFDGALPTGQSQSGPVAGSASVSYDNDLNVSAISAAGATANYGYDADGLLTSAGDLTIARDAANGLETGASLGGTASAITYNQFGEPLQEQTTIPNSPAFTETYTRDAAGRITTKQETSPSGAHTYGYTYDLAGRLVNVTKDGAQYAAYTYDLNGNRTSVTRGAGPSAVVTTSTADARDRMTTSGDLDLTYNANGEMTKKKNRVTGAETTFSYSTLGDLTSATTPAGDHIDYILDGLGRRAGKKVNGNLTQGFIYAPGIGGPVAEQDGNGNTKATFTYATHTNVPDYIEKNGNTYRVITDQLGSPRLIVNASTGAIAQEIEYDEFGRVLSDSNPGFQPFGFAGGIYDNDTGLTHFGAREYDAGLGRWTASDPIGFNGGDSNLYGYVVGDPVNMTDSSGLDKDGPPPPQDGPHLQGMPESQLKPWSPGPTGPAGAVGATPAPYEGTYHPLTLSICLAGGAHAGPVGGSAQLCWHSTPNGNGFSFSAGSGSGLDAYAGLSITDSTAKCMHDLTHGNSGQMQGGYGVVGGTYATNTDGSVQQAGGGASIGPHLGASGDIMHTYAHSGNNSPCNC